VQRSDPLASIIAATEVVPACAGGNLVIQPA
jgi:hypothetical protein